jgi:hypothetical protein
MLGVLAIIYVVIIVPVEYFIKRPTDVIIKKGYDIKPTIDVGVNILKTKVNRDLRF